MLRVKSAYVLYVLKDYAQARKFLLHAEEKLDTVPVEGLRIFEEELIKKMLADLPEEEKAEEQAADVTAENAEQPTDK